MKMSASLYLYDLQPDGYEPYPAPVMCRCGHNLEWHEQAGPFWECLGTCEFNGCACGGFYEEGDDDEV